MKAEIKIKTLPHFQGLTLPRYETLQSAGMDLQAAISELASIRPHERKLIPTGLKMAIPAGYEVQLRPRSGLALREGITVLNSPATIDADYRGEVGIIIINHSEHLFQIKRGDRIAQMVVAPVIQATLIEVEKLDETERGEGGFGSTGIEG